MLTVLHVAPPSKLVYTLNNTAEDTTLIDSKKDTEGHSNKGNSTSTDSKTGTKDISVKENIILTDVKTEVNDTSVLGNTTQIDSKTETENKSDNVQFSENIFMPKGKYNEGVVLVKSENDINHSVLADNGIASCEPLYNGSKWYSAKLKDATKTAEVVETLKKSSLFDCVDFDYIMGADAFVESIDVSSNSDFDKLKHFEPHGIQQGWSYMNDHDYNPGGSSDVVVAVIDTGADYTHLDLRNNIWTNTAEIPNNGRDDDGNGYIDDIYGWDFVSNDKDPMDDNGHGTHVAGIIAAENNTIGGVGVAYNCKVMVLKAGNSSGNFNNSDIAEAIQYAYMNGASVINMSFGGSNISLAVEDALENAYSSCILVAAAGNDGYSCNDPRCPMGCIDAVPVYPAVLPYVIGVMSATADGSSLSPFSNQDHYPYNNMEYEVCAVGESIFSTWPGNKYATLQGTSMAAPSVSGIAALLRSYYTDREVYSSKFIQSQIVNTGLIYPAGDSNHSLPDLYAALAKKPKPSVNLYDYHIDDSTTITDKNNGNGVIDAGETVRLYVSLHNRGGVASNVNVTADVIRGEGLVDPYFTFITSTITLSDIGTYSVRESGDKYFEFVVSPDCPNDYLFDINIHYTYKNGMDAEDTTVYTDDGNKKAQFNVSRGWYLPTSITEDTVFTADRLYIVADDVIIPKGVTVTFKEGCQIQFYSDKEYFNSPKIIVYGTLNMQGTANNMIDIAPSERFSCFSCPVVNNGVCEYNYINAINLSTTGNNISNSILRTQHDGSYVYTYRSGFANNIDYSVSGSEVHNCYIEVTADHQGLSGGIVDGCFIILTGGATAGISSSSAFTNNFVYARNAQSIGLSGNISNNIFTTDKNCPVSNIVPISLPPRDSSNNTFSYLYQQYAAQVISGYYDATGNPTVDVYGSCSDISLLYPYVSNVELFNKNGEVVTTIGKEEITVRVTFNRPMDMSKNTVVSFGSREPYGDYKIEGEYISETVWEGKYTLKAQIENGIQQLIVKNACAKENPVLEIHGEYMLHEFNIDTTVAMAMNLFAEPKENGIVLKWNQDDYDTLMGYNIYRSDSKDGNYVKLNPTILLPSDESFLDDNAEPGKTYWYTYTVVLSDFSESNPAGKVTATAMDTMAPALYHTPVNQGYENNNLVITATASDNVAINSVILYYRTIGNNAWKTLSMMKQNDKYSATIFGSDVTLSGIEYYIVATDGINTVSKGSENAPYTVVVKSANALTRKGDVDGNGVVSTKDALMLMQCLNGDLLLTDDEFKRADLNGDDVLSSVEALRILQYINGKVNTLEM